MDQAVVIQRDLNSPDIVYGTVVLNENNLASYVAVGNRTVVETRRGMRMVES